MPLICPTSHAHQVHSNQDCPLYAQRALTEAERLRRAGFLELLEELKRRNAPDAPASQRISYVIDWSCSRWARNVVDHWQARNLMNELGVRFVSVMEPIVGENTAAASPTRT